MNCKLSKAVFVFLLIFSLISLFNENEYKILPFQFLIFEKEKRIPFNFDSRQAKITTK